MVNLKLLVLIVLALVFVVAAMTVTFFLVEQCADLECFREEMKSCSKAKYLNEGEEATWKYEIVGKEGDECNVEVTLLQTKVGDISTEMLSGFSMTCSIPKGVFVYPEKDLDRCHGRLKEELQVIVISRLHTYLIENLGEIEEGLDVSLRRQ